MRGVDVRKFEGRKKHVLSRRRGSAEMVCGGGTKIRTKLGNGGEAIR